MQCTANKHLSTCFAGGMMYLGLNFEEYPKDWTGTKTVLELFNIKLKTTIPRGKNRVGRLTRQKDKSQDEAKNEASNEAKSETSNKTQEKLKENKPSLVKSLCIPVPSCDCICDRSKLF